MWSSSAQDSPAFFPELLAQALASQFECQEPEPTSAARGIGTSIPSRAEFLKCATRVNGGARVIY